MRPLFFVLLLTSVCAASAQEVDERGRRVAYAARSEINMDVLELDGELVKPTGIAVFNAPRPTFASLLSLRADFNREMLQSVAQVQ